MDSRTDKKYQETDMKKVVGGEVGSGVGKDLNQTIPETMMLAL
jgi:hypothetical protein